MPWEVIEKCVGFAVRRAPPRQGQADVYCADFTSKKLSNTPEEAKNDGLYVMKLLTEAKDRQATRGANPLHGLNATLNHCVMRPAGQSPSNTTTSNRSHRDDSKLDTLQAEHARPSAVLPEHTDHDLSQGRAAIAQHSVPNIISHRASPGMLVQISKALVPSFPGRYVKLGRLLGSGGFASVYTGIVRSGLNQGVADSSQMSSGIESDMLVAVKVFDVIRPGVSPTMLQHMAAKEMEAMQLLQHEAYVTRIFALGQLRDVPEEDGAEDSPRQADTDFPPDAVPCLVLELVSNTLDRSLDYVGHCSEAEAKMIIRQVAQQLDTMHSGQLGGKAIIHGDIKPGNILIRLDGKVALSDFGACHVIEVVDRNLATAAAAAAEVHINCLFASPYYTAPELYHRAKAVGRGLTSESSNEKDVEIQRVDGPAVSDGSVKVDTSFDVFGLGVLVVRMLAGPLENLFAHEPRTAYKADAWEKVLASIVDRQCRLPNDVWLSDTALQFVGCACGVGSGRDSAADHGQPKRFSAAQLLAMPWLQ